MYLNQSLLLGTVHEGTITEVTDKGATVALQYGVEGFEC
jgi:ribosomal protein S1